MNDVPAATAVAKANEEGPAPPETPAVIAKPGHELPYVAPSSYLRPKPNSHAMSEPKPSSPLDKEQMQGLVSLLLPSPPSEGKRDPK